MSTERNKHLVQYTFEKRFNTGELAVLAEKSILSAVHADARWRRSRCRATRA